MERNNQIQLFDSPQFGQLRTHVDKGGQVWFCLNDVAASLEFSNPRNLIQRLNAKGVHTIDTLTAGGLQAMTYINEPNLYRCIFQSRKDAAENYQNWVFEEVLPTIHRTGGYIAAKEDETPAEIMARALKVADATLKRQAQRVQMLEGRVEVQKEHIRVLEPKAEYTDEVLQSPNTYTFTQMAKELDFRTVAHLTAYLKKKGIIFRQSGRWMTTADHSGKGYTKTRTVAFDHSDGRPDTTVYTVWTEPGRLFLHRICNTHKLEAAV